MSISAVSVPDALCQVLRLSSTIKTAFGDTWDGTTGDSKFFTDWADQVDRPYLVFDEVGENYDFDTLQPTGIHSFRADESVIRCWIVQSGRLATRQLAALVCNALNNCDQTNGPITWPDFNGTCKLLDFRMRRAEFAPNPYIGPAAPATFVRVVTFNYTYQGYI